MIGLLDHELTRCTPSSLSISKTIAPHDHSKRHLDALSACLGPGTPHINTYTNARSDKNPFVTARSNGGLRA